MCFLFHLANHISLLGFNHSPWVLQLSKCPVGFSSHTLLHWIGHGPGSRSMLLIFRERKKKNYIQLIKIKYNDKFLSTVFERVFFFFFLVYVFCEMIVTRLVITFLPRSKRLLISWLQSPSAVILEPPKIKSDTVSTVSASISHQVMGPDAVIFVFWMLSFKPTFSLSSFTFVKRLFSSYSLSAIRVVSSAYLRLLIFLLAILIPDCASSSPAFLMMYSA